MLSFAYRSSHGIRKHPIDPLCRVYLNLNSPGRGRPAALLCRGFAQTRPVAAGRKPKAAAKAAAKSKTISETETPKKEKKKAKKAPKADPSTKVKKAKKSPESEASTAATTVTPRKVPSSRLWLTKTPEELSSLWEKSMEIVGDLNKIGPDKLTKSQVTLMAGTLDVIKTVLTSQARKITRAGDKSQSSAGADAEEKDAEGKDAEEKNAGRKDDIFTSLPLRARRKRFEIPATIPDSLKDSKPGHTEDTSIPLSQRPRPGDADSTIPAWHKAHKGSVKTLSAGGLLKPLHVDTPPVPLIQYGLDRVLFNEGVYVLQDPRTGVFNFNPYLARIMPVTEFDFDALKEYITSSKDEILLGVTKEHGKKYTGSTSSMTATLAHFHFLLSNWRKINLARISREYEPNQSNFVSVLKAPAATFLNYNDGVYAIDADKEWDDDTILSMLGKSMEMLLTAPREQYEKYRREVSHKLTAEERNTPESYHYTEFGDFVMRSQLDAYDPRLPGTGIYDLKTRAVVSIRMDATHYEKGRPYEIMKRTGEWESFEREYHDMIRGAFLKYSLQVRMGRMDGIFVAYHNTQRIFGFQYIPLEEMDHSIHGTMNKTLGDKEFQTSLKLWNIMLNKATEKFPGQSLRVHVETRPSQNAPFMYFFAEPVTQDDINKVQVKDQKKVEEFREKVLGISPAKLAVDETDPAVETDETDEDAILAEGLKSASVGEEDSTEVINSEEAMQDAEDEDSEEVWEDIMSVVEETMENDVRGITAIRDAIEEALQQSGLLKARSSEDAQHYIDSLLKAIVDVEAQKTEVESHDENPSMSLDQPGFGSKAAQEVRASQEHVGEAPPTSETQSTAASAFGFLSKVFGGFRKAEDPEPETKTSATASQSSELVDLIKKITSRAGLPSNEAKTVQEVSDDQAKLRNFETLLSELVATDESGEAEPGVASPKKGNKLEKQLFGMILTSRNKVNNDYVDRPEDLSPEDEWKIEYRMEEIPEDKVGNLYTAMKTRRKKAFHKDDPKGKRFDTMFEGNLKRYSQKGAKHRAAMDRLEKMQRPNFWLDFPNPFYMDGKKTTEARPITLTFNAPHIVRPAVDFINRAKENWEKKLKRISESKKESKAEDEDEDDANTTEEVAGKKAGRKSGKKRGAPQSTL